GQPDLPRIESGRQFDGRALGLGAHRLQRDHRTQRLPATVMHRSRRRPDLRVRKSRQLFFAEIDQPPFTLQDRQQLQRLGRPLQPLHSRSELRIENDPEPANDSKPDSRKERRHAVLQFQGSVSLRKRSAFCEKTARICPSVNFSSRIAAASSGRPVTSKGSTTAPSKSLPSATWPTPITLAACRIARATARASVPQVAS